MPMDKERYRSAVSGIRWSDAQRAKITEKLRQPAEKAAGDAFDDEEFDLYEPPMTTEERQRLEKKMAKQERNIRRLSKSGWAVAAVLLVVICGGVTAGIIHTRKLKQEQAKSAQSTFGFHLTDQKDSPSLGLFAKSENGYYFNRSEYKYEIGQSTVRDKNGQLITIDAVQQISGDSLPTFYDPETGESAVLCARPNCTHDGSTYCTATTKVYSEGYSGETYGNDSFTFTYADGYLYAVRVKHDLKTTDDGTEIYDSTQDHVVLLRYEPDGSGITELHDFGTGTVGSRPILHRGVLWFSVQLYTWGEPVKNPITGEDEFFKNGGYEIWGYEPKTGTLAKIFEAKPKPDLNHVEPMPQKICGIGDYIYFETSDGDWTAPSGVNKINILTGEMTQAAKVTLANGFNESYGLYYEDDGKGNAGWRLVNLETGEAKAIPNTQHGLEYVGTPFLSGNYIFWSQVNEGGGSTIRVYDMNCEQVLDMAASEFKFGEDFEGVDADVLRRSVGIAEVTDGKIFFHTNSYIDNRERGIWWTLEDTLYSCPVEDLLAGNAQWTKEIEYMDSAEALKQYQEMLADAIEKDINYNQ